MSQQEIITAIAANIDAIRADESGAYAEQFVAELLGQCDSDTADWLFDSWDDLIG